jgi:hypothetical protein
MSISPTQQALFDAMEPDVWYSDFEDAGVRSFGSLGSSYKRPYYTAGILADRGLLEKVEVEKYAGYRFRRKPSSV